MSDMLTPAGGYGQMFGYTVANIRGDGFEVQNMGREVLRLALPQLVFAMGMQESRNAFGVGKGGTFTVPIFKDWGAPATVSPLVSGTSIGLGTQKTDSVSMSIYEYGTGIAYEKLGDWMTDINLRRQIEQTLGNHTARMLNWLDYDTLVNTAFSIEVPAAGSYTALLGTNRIGVVATAWGELGYGGVALVRDTFKNNVVAPKTSRGKYLWFATPETLRNLKAGSVFQNQVLYSKISSPSFQVLGEFEDFLFVETSEQLGKGTSIVTGANSAGFGFGLTPKVYFYKDYGSDAERLQVWKTLFYRGQGPIFRDKGTTCIVVRSKSGAFNYGGLG